MWLSYIPLFEIPEDATPRLLPLRAKDSMPMNERVGKGMCARVKRIRTLVIFILIQQCMHRECVPLSKSSDTVMTSPVQNSSPYDLSLLLLCQMALLARKAQPWLSHPIGGGGGVEWDQVSLGIRIVIGAINQEVGDGLGLGLEELGRNFKC